MKATVIGIVTGTYDKDGEKRESTQLFVKVPFKKFESEREGMFADGQKTMNLYLPKKVEAKAGDEVYLEFEPGFQDKAQLTGVEVIGKARNEEKTK